MKRLRYLGFSLEEVKNILNEEDIKKDYRKRDFFGKRRDRIFRAMRDKVVPLKRLQEEVKKAYEVLLHENLVYSKGAVGYFVNEVNTEEILLIKKREYIVEFKQMIEKATDDGLTKGDINEILKIVLGEKDYENQSK